MSGALFERVLVANRGEIALRVMRTCRRLGIATVAVASDADWAAPHVREADAVARIGPGPAAESYLRAEALVAAALAHGAQAIHPGYGFLAENPAFAEAVEAAGLTWIGPPPAAMRALGDKAAAKALAERSGVPVLPGYHGDDATDDVLLVRAGAIGYPLVVKASAGGGGRGMRVVRTAGDLADALAAARREAVAAFGDDRLLLERFVERPRHVEVQVLGDAHGGLVHLGERECSVQRRHQKLVEESPSPAVTPSLRDAMGEAALRLARAAGYRNAGTVEFLLDEADAFFFLEVNARLQVEHPVTEAVTGLDLVEQQLRVAAGEPLGFGQADVRLDGWAMELRVVAEDPTAGFLPSTGVVTDLAWPDGIRVDAGVEAGTRVSPHYDSLLAKLVADGADRAAVVGRLRRALDETWIEGPATNLALLAAVLDEPAFVAGDLHTGFLDAHGIVERLNDVPPAAVAAVAAARWLAPSGPPPAADPWLAGRPWRVARVGEPGRWRLGDGSERLTETRPGRQRGAAMVDIDGQTFGATLMDGDEDTGWRLAIAAPDPNSDDGHLAIVESARGRRRHARVTWHGRQHRLTPAPPPTAARLAAEADEPDALSAPMPGRIARLHVAEGDHVRANAPLVVLEAMKMEHVIAAASPGRVTRLHVALGDQVPRGAPLVELEAHEEG